MSWDRLQSFDGTAIKLEDGQEICYRRLAQLSDDSVADLCDKDLAAIECNNSLESLAAYLGCLRRCIPVMLMDASLAPSLKEKILQQFCFSVVFSSIARSGWHRLREFGPEVHSELALLLSTSGTTGSSKLVKLSHRNLIANSEQIAEYLGLTASSIGITSLPQHYSYGLSVINSHLSVGGTLALTNAGVLERRFWDLIRSAHVQLIAGVPSTFEMLSRLELDQMDVSSLRVLTQAGGRLQKCLVEKFATLCHSRGWAFYVMYGQTEATARMSYLPPDRLFTKSESVGIPVPGGRFELMDVRGQVILEPNITGELVFYGDNVMMGYANDVSDLALGDVNAGRLATGDLAYCDAEKFLYLKGRLHRFVKISGHRVGLDELEMHVQQCGLEVVIAGRDDFILVVGLTDESLDQSIAILGRDFRVTKSVLRKMKVINFPLSPTGKTSYSKLLDLFDAKGLDV